ncbi:hypothetical protein HMPREF0578_0599 [Mobiluncus mulieris 28-1]|uniref:type II toxin-antitoxin system YafQ family toxin n=1 Tax=Mobiluncus mulieris TaxID=2052 RepID=UPI00019F8E09|nr:type II toxin-antitoxin system YafQ family toxin [Mobiluncus mulieris]EEJ53065.1 hypothetical protein HMPREF0577_1965 [Mobiluncus mulieris ATCC 35243]EEZ90633.1 hypothetical protein HMPREF0578_0599 [Mobiluncus mulieris 28-1]MCV0002405.1 hypothetical protein [Mobiluncus mulieris]PNL42778.1 hypothetical protein CEP82_002540 [Mobiluncus mulieris]SPX70446.1 Uncharacterised protein [Mobiluncus mulieris]
MNVVFDTRFQTDLKRVARYQPNIVYELRELIDAINELGEIPAVYNSHLLIQPRGNYTGYWELHAKLLKCAAADNPQRRDVATAGVTAPAT